MPFGTKKTSQLDRKNFLAHILTLACNRAGQRYPDTSSSAVFIRNEMVRSLLPDIIRNTVLANQSWHGYGFDVNSKNTTLYNKMPLNYREKLMPNPLALWCGTDKIQSQKMGFFEPPAGTLCECEEEEDTVHHRLKCSMLNESGSISDLANFSNRARQCVKQWKALT